MQLRPDPPDRVWYLAYGSNVNEARFLRYLDGDDSHRGARDATPPARSVWTEAPLRLRFAGESTRWGDGGVCFVDPDPAARCHVRAWDITAEQFEDVFAQENRLPGTIELDWPAFTTRPTEVLTSWYGRIVPVDLAIASPRQPALTFTWHKRLPVNPPSVAYRETIEAGLAENPALSPAEIMTYLDQAAELSPS